MLIYQMYLCYTYNIYTHKKMLLSKKNINTFLTIFLFILLSFDASIHQANAAGECGKMTLNAAAISLSPCLGAAGNPKIKVPPLCCAKVNALIKSDPRCLCAVLLSPLAKKAGIKPGIGIGVPKRCNIRNRPVGKKCGPYIVP